MSSPEDKKIDFEKLTLSEDLSGSLEPIADGAGEQPLPGQKPEPVAKKEPLPTLDDVMTEEEESAGR